jgi:hypothetical protein
LSRKKAAAPHDGLLRFEKAADNASCCGCDDRRCRNACSIIPSTEIALRRVGTAQIGIPWSCNPKAGTA